MRYRKNIKSNKEERENKMPNNFQFFIQILIRHDEDMGVYSHWKE